MHTGIRLKLFFISLLLIGTSVIAGEIYLTRSLEAQLLARIQADLLVRARLVAARASEDAETMTMRRQAGADFRADELGRIAGVRVTLVRRDGSVAGDSEVESAGLAALENHAAREEVAAALAGGEGISVRRSATVGTRLMYVAVSMTGARGEGVAGAARVALPLTSIDEAVSELQRSLASGALIALLVAVIISLSAAHLTSRTLRRLTDAARAMAAGDLGRRTRVKGRDEIAALGGALDHLADNLSRNLEELRSERDLLNGVLSGMSEGVLVIGPDQRIALANPALRAMLLMGQDPRGKTVLQAIRNSELIQMLQQVAASGQAEAELDLAGLRPCKVLVRAVKLPDEMAGGSGSTLAVFVDVTEFRKLEAVRRDFVANASHELRSPLTTVRAAAEALQGMENDPAGLRQFTELIQRNAARLSELVDDLLELSRIESRELKLELEALDPYRVAERILAQHAHRAELKHIVVTQELAGAPLIRADRRALEHILANLVDNALKYCPPGSSVAIRCQVEGGQALRITVADNGPGIAPEHLDRVFERFYRVDAGRSRELGGTGLGLSIVRHLVEAMQGVASVASTPGTGSEFSFTLPLA
jgi:two-component system phosphate regulon sensor histidine kinase PhoR